MGYQKGYKPPSWEKQTTKKLEKSIRSLIELADKLIDKKDLKGSEVSSLLRDMFTAARLLKGESTENISVRSASDASIQLTGLMSGLVATIKRLPPAGQRKIWEEIRGAFNKIDTEPLDSTLSQPLGLENMDSPLLTPAPIESIPVSHAQRGQHPDYGDCQGQVVEGEVVEDAGQVAEGEGSQGEGSE